MNASDHILNPVPLLPKIAGIDPDGIVMLSLHTLSRMIGSIDHCVQRKIWRIEKKYAGCDMKITLWIFLGKVFRKFIIHPLDPLLNGAALIPEGKYDKPVSLQPAHKYIGLIPCQDPPCKFPQHMISLFKSKGLIEKGKI